ncbi:hypothetical protein TSMEX_008490 [Taenia solium]|eukprot:TsM_000593800 transcript=TsM_000593800 gene=TsM_000593800
MIDGSRQPIGTRDYVETRCMCVWAYTYTRRRDNAREGVERTGCCCGDQLKKQESSSEELPSHSLDLFYFLCPTPPLIRGDLLIQMGTRRRIMLLTKPANGIRRMHFLWEMSPLDFLPFSS